MFISKIDLYVDFTKKKEIPPKPSNNDTQLITSLFGMMFPSKNIFPVKNSNQMPPKKEVSPITEKQILPIKDPEKINSLPENNENLVIPKQKRLVNNF